MIRFAFNFLCAIILLLGGGVEKVEKLTDSFKKASLIRVYDENIKYEFDAASEQYQDILMALQKICEYAHEMPAFGVSLDNLTKEEVKTGMWIELEFEHTMSHEAMTFDALLIRINKEYFGFNLIRRNAGQYNGRCFYLSLDGNMELLYDAAQNAIKKK